MLLALGAAWGPAVQAQTSVSAFVNRNVIGADETVTLTVEVTGPLDQIGRIDPPDTRGLTLLQQTPQRSAQSVTINGRTTQQLVLRWTFRPFREGEAQIGGVSVNVAGQRYQTNAITVQVEAQGRSGQRRAPPTAGPAPRPPVSQGRDVFIRAEPSARAVVPGEQVVVDFVLYYNRFAQPRATRIVGAWDTPGFWREELELPTSATTPRTVTLGGQTYESVPIKRVALFPTRAGPDTLRLGALPFEVDVVRRERVGRDNPFYNPFARRFERVRVESPSVPLRVRALPPGPPASFSGAAGQFGLAMEVDQDAASAGEGIEVEVTLTGDGNLATLEAPELQVPPSFQVYPPRSFVSANRRAAPLRGRKTFVFTVVPEAGGAFEIGPIVWTYYDTQAGRYRTLRAPAATVNVVGPAAPRAEATPAARPSLAPDVPAGLLPAGGWRSVDAPLARFPWEGAGVSLVALLALAALAVRQRTGWGRDEDALRRKRAPREAARRLQAAAALSGAAFYREVETTLRAFLEDRHSLRTHGLDRSSLQRALEAFSPESRAETVALLARCEDARYLPGGADDPDACAEVRRRADALLKALEDLPSEPEAVPADA